MVIVIVVVVVVWLLLARVRLRSSKTSVRLLVDVGVASSTASPRLEMVSAPSFFCDGRSKNKKTSRLNRIPIKQQS